MPIDLADLIGYAAAVLTTVAFFPQGLKSWQTCDLSGVSLTMYGLFTAGARRVDKRKRIHRLLMLVDALRLSERSECRATLPLASVVLLLKLRHR